MHQLLGHECVEDAGHPGDHLGQVPEQSSRFRRRGSSGGKKEKKHIHIQNATGGGGACNRGASRVPAHVSSRVPAHVPGVPADVLTLFRYFAGVFLHTGVKWGLVRRSVLC